jgi:uncharacterized protein YcgI (DUF1989 family)
MHCQASDCPKTRAECASYCPNINFFMNVPVTPEGHLMFDDGISAPGNMLKLKQKWI